MNIPPLPLDVYIQILSHLIVSRHPSHDVDVKTLARCSLVNTNLREAACLPTLWKPHYRARYLHSNISEETRRVEEANGDWRLLYAARRRLDARALNILDKIVSSRSKRLEHAKTLAELAYDVWDVLELQNLCAIPEIFRDHDIPDMLPVVPHAVTRQFWARAVLQAIARGHAVRLWGHLLAPGGSQSASLEETFVALSCFFGKDPAEISITLNSLADACKSYLKLKNITWDSENSNYDLVQICTGICDCLHIQGYGPADERFHNILNQFPHRYLSTHKRAIPISLVQIFVAVARRLDIAASPVGFPSRVLAHVASPNPTVDDIYIDVYGSDVKPIISVEHDIPQLLARMGYPASSTMRWISPCTAAPMLIRAGRNILASYRMMTQYMQADSTEIQTAAYVGLTIELMSSGDRAIIPLLMEHVELPAFECVTVLSSILTPLLPPLARSSLSRVCETTIQKEKDAATAVKRRSSSNPVKYFVGMFSQDVNYRYQGCIVGWDPICVASEEWITKMAVDTLIRGRNQPFYSVLWIDGSYQYVAEDSIAPMSPTRDLVVRFLRKASRFGMHFDDVQGGEKRKRMVLSSDLRTGYPDDDQVGDMWLKEEGEETV